ncbi:MAG: hypothetical protein DRJ56_01645 [Thermoprotei archaeon]|nr:MAG: hypothetical protein DRJ56_01645 [Thermoprotei archaeon]
MGRRRLRSTVERAKKIYHMLVEFKEEKPTSEILMRAIAVVPNIDYATLYQTLRLLRSKGLVEQIPRGRISYWRVVRVVSDVELEKILSR